jgi:hypothetical protein
LENFVQAGRQIGIDVELIGKKDYPRLTEYDALFIRETTAVDHHTYQFAQKAEFAHMPVIDDPNSILKCANKVYLAELLRENEMATPRSEILYRDQPATLERKQARKICSSARFWCWRKSLCIPTLTGGSACLAGGRFLPANTICQRVTGRFIIIPPTALRARADMKRWRLNRLLRRRLSWR